MRAISLNIIYNIGEAERFNGLYFVEVMDREHLISIFDLENNKGILVPTSNVRLIEYELERISLPATN